MGSLHRERGREGSGNPGQRLCAGARCWGWTTNALRDGGRNGVWSEGWNVCHFFSVPLFIALFSAVGNEVFRGHALVLAETGQRLSSEGGTFRSGGPAGGVSKVGCSRDQTQKTLAGDTEAQGDWRAQT